MSLAYRLSLFTLMVLPLLSGCVTPPMAETPVQAKKDRLAGGADASPKPDIAATPKPVEATPAIAKAPLPEMDEPAEEIIPVVGTEPVATVDVGTFGAYAPLVAFSRASASERKAGIGEKSVVLMPAKSIESVSFTVCDTMPSAVLVDLDLNGGLERDAVNGATSSGARDAFDAIRSAGIKVIYMASAPASRSPAISAALNAAGLGPAIHGDTLWLVGDRGSYNRDSLRWKIASFNCIVAMAGDAPGDFSTMMGDREKVSGPNVPSLIVALDNAGWFTVPSLLSTVPGGGGQ